MAFSQYLADQIQAAFVSNTDITAPANYFLALHTADPTKACDQDEKSGDGYARTAISFQAQTAATTENLENSAAVVFPTATGTSAAITHYSVYDNATVGNPWFYGVFDSSIPWNSGASVAFAIASIKNVMSVVPVSGYTEV